MKKLHKKGSLVMLVMGILIVALLAAGCANLKGQNNNENGDMQEQPGVSADPQKTPVNVTLYFSDDQAMYLVTEEREVMKQGETMEEVVIRELIKGPQEPGNMRTIPEEARLISVEVVDGVAYVNFSKEFKTKHWGGTAGESHTLYSVVNSVTELEGIEKVQFLLEGDTMDSLGGHMDTSQPIAPDAPELLSQ